jgi:cell division protein FtsQ
VNAVPRHYPGDRSAGFGSGFFVTFLLFVVAACGIAWVYMGMVASERWPIRWMQIDGRFQRVSAEQIRATLASHVNRSFFTVDLNAMGATASKMPWVSQVEVKKSWPDTVYVLVDEYVPLAHWREDQLVSDTGVAFSVPGAGDMQGLPSLDGPPGELERVWEHWHIFNQELLPLGLEVDTIRLDRRGAWSLILNNGTEVDLGRDDELPRLQRLVASWSILTSGKSSTPTGVDLRYTNGFAVRWPDNAGNSSGS